MNIKLSGFAPDADPTIAGILTNCSGVVPSLRGLKGAPTLVVTSMATLAGTCTGAFVGTLLDDSTRQFAGTDTKLYETAGSVWSDISSTTYSSTSIFKWRFAQYGNVSLASNANNTVQASVASGTVFSNVSTAPKASIIETVNNFVFAINYTDSTGAVPDGVSWCALGNYLSWTASIATQAGNTRLTSSPGQLTAGRRFGDAIIVYKRRAMYLGIYAGPPFIWAFTQIPGESGAVSQEAVVDIGTAENPKHIFMGMDNFYLYDGSKPIPIGTNRVKIQVFNNMNASRYYACTTLHDRVNSLVYFYYPVVDSPFPDHCVVYNYRTDQWGQDDRQIEATTQFVSPGITYGGLGSFYTNYNDLPDSPYDTAFLNQAAPIPAIFNTSHILNTLTGAAGTTNFTTGDYGDPEYFTSLQRVRPIFLTSPTSATMTNYYKESEGNTLTAGVTTTLGSHGTFDVIRDARWHRAQMNFVGDWEMAEIVAEAPRSSLE